MAAKSIVGEEHWVEYNQCCKELCEIALIYMREKRNGSCRHNTCIWDNLEMHTMQWNMLVSQAWWKLAHATMQALCKITHVRCRYKTWQALTFTILCNGVLQPESHAWRRDRSTKNIHTRM